MAHTVVVLSLELLHISHLHNSPHAALAIAGKHKTTNKQRKNVFSFLFACSRR
jgi:hypothetical protein